MSRVHIGGLAWDVSQKEVQALVEKCGKVTSVELPPSVHGDCRGYGFVTFSRKTDAERFIQNYNNAIWRGGKRLFVADAKPPILERRALEDKHLLPAKAHAMSKKPAPIVLKTSISSKQHTHLGTSQTSSNADAVQDTTQSAQDFHDEDSRESSDSDSEHLNNTSLKNRPESIIKPGSHDNQNETEDSDSMDQLPRVFPEDEDNEAVYTDFMQTDRRAENDSLDDEQPLDTMTSALDTFSQENDSDKVETTDNRHPPDIQSTMLQESDKALDLMNQLLLEQPEPTFASDYVATSEKAKQEEEQVSQNKPDTAMTFCAQHRYDPTEDNEKDENSNQWSALRDVFTPAAVTALGDGSVALSFAASGKQLEHKFNFGLSESATPVPNPPELPSITTTQLTDDTSDLFKAVPSAVSEGRSAFMQIDLERIYEHYKDHHAALMVSFKRAKRKARAAVDVDIDSGVVRTSPSAANTNKNNNRSAGLFGDTRRRQGDDVGRPKRGRRQ